MHFHPKIPPRLGEPLLAPGGGRRLVLLLVAFCALWALKYAHMRYIGHTYADDPACVHEHFPACKPMLSSAG